MALNIPALVLVIVFYIAIVLVAFFAARFIKNPDGDDGTNKTELNMVAGRNLHLAVGIFTMSATSVGGAYLAGTTEYIALSGLVWTVYPFTIVCAFTVGSLVYAKPMRERGYLTLLDPLQEQFGDVMTGLLLLGALFAEILWGASVLIALGSCLSIIVDLPLTASIIVSSCVAWVYTMFGQMVSVAYTDVIQLVFVIIGMVLCVPFAMTNEHVMDIGSTSGTWLGSLPTSMAASWVDYVLSQIFGGIPWNTYFMRILSARSVRDAQITSLAGGIFTLCLGVPPFLLGVVGVSTDWNSTEYGRDPIAEGNAASLMPLVIQYLTPYAVSVIALSAIVAAVMSSMDSIILSSSSMFTHNIYKMAIRNEAGDLELAIVQRVAMFVVAAISTVLALTTTTVAGLFVLTADIVYVVLFPQLTCAVFLPFTNAYGSFAGFVLCLILRFGGGEPTLNLAPFIEYPYFDGEFQLFPYKTMAMLCGFIAIVSVSYLFKWLFQKGYLPEKMEITGKIKIGLDITDTFDRYNEHETIEAYYNIGSSFGEVALKESKTLYDKRKLNEAEDHVLCVAKM